ncbi:hypothetical protein ACVWWG_006952 [Bradyrhizobium sp. LB7.2]
MKTMTAACALGMALVLCNLGISGAEARARKAQIIREPQQRLIVTAPVLRPDAVGLQYRSAVSLSS